ncbi:MAG: hypothetical protein JW810_09740, partial [Sedimentisphaerales bacterium]|nr:hypothetical protein [Sedimentisphaerales bacterium]
NQTLALDASNNVSAEWTTVFGKMTEVNLVGRGSASVLSLEGNIADETVLRRIANDARAGRANANLVTMEGMAHVGYVAVSAGSKVNVKDVLVNGDLGDLDATNVRSLWVSDDAGSIDIGNKINKAFIGNDVQEFSARVAQNVLIGGDANFVSAFKMIRSTVAGTTNFLNIDGALIYSTFADTNAWTVNRIYRSVLG